MCFNFKNSNVKKILRILRFFQKKIFRIKKNTIFIKNLKMKIHITAIILFFVFQANAQDKKAYQLFDANGKKTTYQKLVDRASETNIVLFGEYHNNSISHWLQFELTTDIAQKKKIVLGAEMLEADNQKQVNQ